MGAGDSGRAGAGMRGPCPLAYATRPEPEVHVITTAGLLRAAAAELLIWGLTRLAAALAGQHHAHLGDAWNADLHGDPAAGKLPPDRFRLWLAAGFVKAAVCCRLSDAAESAWRPADALLASWRGSRLAMLTPVTVAVVLILSHEGFYGLVTNAENLGVIAAAPYAAIRGLRKYRQISTPRRPEKKSPAADGTER